MKFASASAAGTARPVLVNCQGHGQRYFSRVTAIFTGKRPLRYGPHGRKYRPQTFTWELGPLAG
jgi:hypothetical protein